MVCPAAGLVAPEPPGDAGTPVAPGDDAAGEPAGVAVALPDGIGIPLGAADADGPPDGVGASEAMVHVELVLAEAQPASSNRPARQAADRSGRDVFMARSYNLEAAHTGASQTLETAPEAALEARGTSPL